MVRYGKIMAMMCMLMIKIIMGWINTDLLKEKD
jgi:hypothetical protein